MSTFSKSMTHLLEHAHCGYIGINDALEVSSGYDQQECEASVGYVQADWHDQEDVPLPRQDRIALAVLMIHRWSRYLHVAFAGEADTKDAETTRLKTTADQLANALEMALEDSQSAINQHIAAFGGNYRPDKLEEMRQQLEASRALIAQHRGEPA